MVVGVVIWKGVYEWGLILLWGVCKEVVVVLRCSRWFGSEKTVGGGGLECRLLLKSIPKPTLKTIPKIRVGIVQILKELYGFCVW